jgi:hypothetical protein
MHPADDGNLGDAGIGQQRLFHLLTTESLIVEKPKKEEAAGHGGGHGHGHGHQHGPGF